MLDRLVVSKNHREENKKLNNLFSGIFSLAAIALVFAFVISLYSFELELGTGDLELSSLTAPVLVEETQVEPQKMQKTQTNETVKSDMPSRVENIQRLEESPVKPPNNVSVTPSKNQARPNVPFRKGLTDFTPANTTGLVSKLERDGKIEGTGIPNEPTKIIEKTEKEIEPVIQKPVVKKEEPKKETTIVSGGVVNGKAKFLAQPAYPAAAKAVRAGGKVEVQVMIDENGRVISANVVSGNPLLRDSALNAARRSTFAPTTLSNNPVKVSGIIVYNFNP